jgi:restriction system protein
MEWFSGRRHSCGSVYQRAAGNVEEFQSEFEQTWLKSYLQPTVSGRCDPLLTYSEPLLPAWFEVLPDAQKDKFLSLKRRHDEFGWLMMTFTSYMRILQDSPFPQLPLRPRVAQVMNETVIPDDVLDAVGYREFLDAALTHSDEVIARFRALRPNTESSSQYE